MNLDIRSFVLGIAVVAVLAIGVFVVVNRTDDTAHAAPEASHSQAVPQGVVGDLSFECTSWGITKLMNFESAGDYSCDSDANPGIICNGNQAQTALQCSDGTTTSTCTITDGTDNSQAECTDTEGGSHVCSVGAYGFTCETTSTGGRDFIECDHDGPFGAFACGTPDGPLICMTTFAQSLTILCGVLSGIPTFFWADVDCDAEITSRDNQALLRKVLGNAPLSQTEPCPNLGDPVDLEPERFY